MQKALKDNAVMISYFSLLLVAGFVLTAMRSGSETHVVPVAVETPVPPVPVAPVEVAAPFFVPPAETPSIPVETPSFAFVLPERESAVVETADVAPPVTRNGKTGIPELAPEPAFELTIEPETMTVVPEKEPVLVAEAPCLKKKTPPPANDTTWVPYLYYYRRSVTWCPPQFYVYPLADCRPDCMTEEEPKVLETEAEAAMPNELVPVFYVFPIQQQPFMPQVVSKRHGAPKFVYPNGVIVKPKIYVRGQPVRNSVRAMTP